MEVHIIAIPKKEDPKGNLGVIEGKTIPFEIKRVFYLFDVPAFTQRGCHAHKTLKQVAIAVSGTFDVVLKDGKTTQKVTLDNPEKGLLIDCNIWGELENFSEGAVCLVLASDDYDEKDYIRNYDAYLDYIKTIQNS